MTNKSIEEIEQDEKQLDEVRKQLFGSVYLNQSIILENDLPMYLGDGPEKQPDDLQIGKLTNVRIENGKIIGDIKFSDEYIDIWKKKFEEFL